MSIAVSLDRRTEPDTRLGTSRKTAGADLAKRCHQSLHDDRVATPLTTNLRRAALPSCVQVAQGDGGLSSDSVVLCHQMRVLDKGRLKQRLGVLSDAALLAVEARLLLTLGVS